jgi:ribonuclease Z
VNLWVVGSGTLVPDGRRGAPAYWIEVGPRAILMDCGAGTLRTLARLKRPWEGTTHVLLSHLHTDHVGELAPLLFALKHGIDPPRTDPLLFLGPEGLADHLEHLAAAHGAYVLDPGFPLGVTELVPGEGWESADGALRVRSTPARHTRGALALRLEAGEATLGYTGDTGPDPELGGFLRGCGVLIAECSHPDHLATELHLTPATLLPLARAADPELLLTVHAYPPLDPETVPSLLARDGYEGRVRAGIDGLRVELDGERVIVKGPVGLGSALK